VDEVIFTKSPEGEDVVRLRTRAMRVPEIGDKFCSRYAQKGTIGAVYDEVDMPFSPESGCTPDLIINAHGQPSRMTIGHILETLCGKAAALRGEQVDGTPFVVSADADDHPDGVVNKFGAQLEAFGFKADGCETLYDGRTGRPLEMQVFVGPVAYSKLRHMVVDKYHARSRGPRSFQTRQPLDGRGRDGGQRVGEMERDCCIAHGASFVLEERLLTSSDQVDVFVCAECGAFAHQPQTTNGNPAHCARCLSSRILRQTIPHGYRLSVQENAALHMDQRIVVA
jgi:DNA-directed RNA polymerase beta subunit